MLLTKRRFFKVTLPELNTGPKLLESSGYCDILGTILSYSQRVLLYAILPLPL